MNIFNNKQKRKRLNVALLSPNENAYSETFIRAHKTKIKENIFYYYGGFVPAFLEGGDNEIIVNDLKQSLLENNIDIVLAEFGVTAAESLPFVKSLGIPLVVHFHGFDAHSSDIISKYKEQYNDVFEYAQKIIVVSQFMRKQLLKLGCQEDKIVYTVCAPSENFFSVNSLSRSRQFLAVGRFVDKKAPYYTVLAFSEVVKKCPDVKLKMAADGPLLATCKNLARHLKLQDSIEFIGVIGSDAIESEMAKSLAFVQHSIVADNGDSEGTPVAVMEAGAAGLPVIATRHAGIIDVVENEKTGLLVDEHDVDGMANAMIRIAEDFDFAHRLGKNAREKIHREFSMERHISIIEKSLRESVQGKIKTDLLEVDRTSGINKFKNKVKFAVLTPGKFIRKYLSKVRPKTIIVVNHYFGEGKDFNGKSSTQDSIIRKKIVERVVRELRTIPRVDVVVCGIKGKNLLSIDWDFSEIEDPSFLVYESIERMASQVDKYDYFINIEDDVLLTQETFRNILEFDKNCEINECLHPNRMEQDKGMQYCVDLKAWPGWTDKSRKYKEYELKVAKNPHSGVSVLSREKLLYALKTVDLKRRDIIVGHYMASAYANLHEPFLLFRTSDNLSAHKVMHLDKWNSK